MAGEITIARESRVNPINAVSRRTSAYGGTLEQSVNRRAERLMRQYASWDNPLAASDWNILNAERIGSAVGRMLRR